MESCVEPLDLYEFRGEKMVSATSATSNLKDVVRSYWQAQPCNTEVGKSQRLSRAWFDEIEQSRYEREPFIHSFAQFTRWRGKKVLEIGCGAGTDSLQFARAGADLTSVDLTPAAIELTQQRLALYGVAGDVRLADAEALPFEDNQFDLVYSWGVLHHTPDTERALAELYRVLRPGGRFVVMLYNRHSVITLRLYLRYGLRAGHPFRSLRDVVARNVESEGTKAYTRSEIQKLFRHFESVEVQSVLTPYDTRRLPRWVLSWLPNAWGWFTVATGLKPVSQERPNA